MRLNGVEAVMFDMDGTLIDSEPLWFEAGRAVAARLGITVPDEAASELWGLDIAALLELLEARYGVRLEAATFTELLNEAALVLLPQAPAREGAQELVEAVAARALPRAIVSNSSAALIEAALRPHPWAQLVPERFSVDEVARGKPDPALYLHAAQRLGVVPERCVAIEDSVVGVTAAVRAGMRCVALVVDEAQAAALKQLTPWCARSLTEVKQLLN